MTEDNPICQNFKNFTKISALGAMTFFRLSPIVLKPCAFVGLGLGSPQASLHFVGLIPLARAEKEERSNLSLWKIYKMSLGLVLGLILILIRIIFLFFASFFSFYNFAKFDILYSVRNIQTLLPTWGELVVKKI